MYAGFQKHRTFDRYKEDYLTGLSGRAKPASDFVLRECWINGVPPYDVHSNEPRSTDVPEGLDPLAPYKAHLDPFGRKSRRGSKQ